jgi:cell division protein FtsB
MQKRLFLTPLAIILFIMYFTVFGDRGLLRINHLHRDLDEMQQSLTTLQGENEKLKREIAALQSDRRYLESIARRDFGLVRSNEVVYQFPPQQGQGTAPQGTGAKGEAPHPAASQPPVSHPVAPLPALQPSTAPKAALKEPKARQGTNDVGAAHKAVTPKQATAQPQAARPAAPQAASKQ